MKQKRGMLIDYAEIASTYGPEVIPALDLDPETQIRATRNGKRYRPAVEKKLAYIR